MLSHKKYGIFFEIRSSNKERPHEFLSRKLDKENVWLPFRRIEPTPPMLYHWALESSMESQEKRSAVLQVGIIRNVISLCSPGFRRWLETLANFVCFTFHVNNVSLFISAVTTKLSVSQEPWTISTTYRRWTKNYEKWFRVSIISRWQLTHSFCK